jgi:hypothetical protein
MAAARKARELGEELVEVQGHAREARRLINSGADVNNVARWMREEGEMIIKSLIRATILGHANVISALIERRHQ